MARKVTPRPDGQEWLRRWDRQREVCIPSRETCYQTILDALAHFLYLSEAGVDRPFLALDLACGPGSITSALIPCDDCGEPVAASDLVTVRGRQLCRPWADAKQKDEA